VSSVISQDYADWELIISDNASEEDVKGYIDSLTDARIKYFRTESFVSVTENWNNALSRTTGEYVTLLGDDDCLMPGYFSTLAPLITNFDRPEVIHTDGYLFLYPGIAAERTNKAMLLTGTNTLFRPSTPYLLTRQEALDRVANALRIRIDFLYNLQLFVIRRDLITRLAEKGAFFQSPFPDYFALVVLFLMAKSILIYQEPLAVVGISPKSIGFLLFNKREREGEAQLNNQQEYRASRLADKLFPGNYEIANRLIAMDTFQEKYQTELDREGLAVNYGAFRWAQIRFNYERYFLDRLLPKENFELARQQMRPMERLICDLLFTPVLLLLRTLSPRIRGGLVRRFRQMLGQRIDYGGKRWSQVEYNDILEVTQHLPARHPAQKD
jgi:glycosyltransferase involved in cell wall biosynthesis